MTREHLMANGNDNNDHGVDSAGRLQGPGVDVSLMPPVPGPKKVLLEVITRLEEGHQRLADDMRRLKELVTLLDWERGTGR
jgi:hypothetical protein